MSKSHSIHKLLCFFFFFSLSTFKHEGNGRFYEGDAEKPDIAITVSDENFGKLAEGKLNAQQVFISLLLFLRGEVHIRFGLFIIWFLIILKILSGVYARQN